MALAVDGLVAVETLVATDVGVTENGEGGARKAADVNVIRSGAGDSVE